MECSAFQRIEVQRAGKVQRALEFKLHDTNAAGYFSACCYVTARDIVAA